MVWWRAGRYAGKCQAHLAELRRSSRVVCRPRVVPCGPASHVESTPAPATLRPSQPAPTRASRLVRAATAIVAAGGAGILLMVTILKYLHELIEAARIG